MRLLIGICFAACLLGSVAIVRATQDVIVPASEVRFVTPAIKGSGPITITADFDPTKFVDTTWKSFQVEAFGKTMKLSDKQLAKLTGYPVSSLIITCRPEFLDGKEESFQIKVSKSKQDGDTTVNSIVPISVSSKDGIDVGDPYSTTFVPNSANSAEKK